jgi:hypothetical protein
MALLSPGILVKEKDFSTIVPVVASAIGGIAGDFTKGPIETPILIDTETTYVDVFGPPTESNFGVWFAGAQFLLYANKLWVVRSAPAGCKNAGSTAGVQVKNFDDYVTKMDNGTLSAAGHFVAKQPGLTGNGIKIILVDNGNFAATAADPTYVDHSGAKYTSFIPTTPGTSNYVADRAVAGSTTKYDEVSVVVIDTLGTISGTANTVLETFNYCSKAVDAVDYKNTSAYYVDVVNSQSKYVYWVAHNTTTNIETATGTDIFAWGSTAFDVAVDSGDHFALMSGVVSFTLIGAVAGTTPTASDHQNAYDQFKEVEEIDVNLIITGNHSVETMAHVLELASARKDAMAFVSPHTSGDRYMTRSTMTTDLVAFKASLNVADQFQSYGVMDTGFKYIYDQYNRRYRWVPLNGDIAGVVARVDDIADPWWSPGGFNRGGLKNVIKVSFNPNQSERDILYPKGINPVVTFPGSGTILFGDRTMQEKPSAFDRINVRRLFIILEKSISIAAKYQLFEFNDSFTRAMFKNMVEPFLRDVQGRRGITDFKVVCDTSNNTGEVIDRNEFIADIYVKPARSINFIYLNFVATKTGVDFSTVIGA